MRKRIICKWMTIVLAGCMALSTSVFAADLDTDLQDAPNAASYMEESEIAEEAVDDAYVIDEDEAETVAADDAYDDAAVGTYDIEIDDLDDDAEILEDAVSVSEASPVSDAPVPSESADVVSQVKDEELVGALQKISLNTTYTFSCTKGDPDPNYQIYSFKPTSTAVYRVDITGTKGKTISGAMFYNNDDPDDPYDVIDHGVYTDNDLKYTLYLQQGRTYYFYVGPDTNRAESGKFKLRKIAKTIDKSEVRYYKDKILTVGPKGAGSWAINDDGKKNFDVWLFSIDELRSIL